MISAGSLRDRIKLVKPTFVSDGYQDVPAFEDVVTTWANVFHVSDAEKYAGGQVNVVATLRVTIRKRSVAHDWRVVYRGQSFAITGIKESYRDRDFLEISCGLVD